MRSQWSLGLRPWRLGVSRKWYFGMKAHIGVDSQTRQIHSVVATAANVHDSQVLGDLLHGEETRYRHWRTKGLCSCSNRVELQRTNEPPPCVVS
jgi:IS5 family transposase